jgi:ferrochelatase
VESTAVLLMAYGSPNSPDEIEAYLMDIRGGRPTPPALVEEIRARYIRIGGRSPLLEITRLQAAALEEALNRRSQNPEDRPEIEPASSPGVPAPRFKTYVGMRHWEPRIGEAVAQIVGDGLHRVVGLVMAPHASRLSTGAYFAKMEEGIQAAGADMDVGRIESWHDHPGLIAALAEKASQALKRFERTPFVLFTAHSLPARILANEFAQQGDPYDLQLRETAALVASKLGLLPNRWQFCYQSAGQSQEPWLGPQIGQVIPELAQAGERDLLVTPVGFLCDHVEILYDLDIEARAIAQRHGLRLERSESLNTSPTFIAALADLVLSHEHPVPGR